MPVVSDYTALLSGYSWSGFNASNAPVIVTYSFEDAAQSYLSSEGYSSAFIATFASFTLSERVTARAAMDAWAQASGLILLEVQSGEGDVRFAKYDLDLSANAGAAGFAYYPSRDLYVFDGQVFEYDLAIGGDVFIDTEFVAQEYLLLHEIGHALGFKHPFDGDPTLEPSLNTASNTIMGYNGFTFTGGLGVFDEQAAAFVYGQSAADGTHVASWSWDGAARILTQTGGATADKILGVNVRDVLRGAEGADTLVGFGGDDTLLGGGGVDALIGGEGADNLSGGSGADFLDGGINASGTFDYARYDDANYGDLVISMASPWTNTGAAQGDRYSGIEGIVGGVGNDLITGSFTANALWGAGGSDTIEGGAGSDYLNGGDGGDTLSYRNSDAPVTVNLNSGTAAGGHAQGDTVRRFESLLGSGFGDTLSGNTGNNVINGGGGDDSINAWHGNDYIFGGAGNDTLKGSLGADRFYFDTALNAVTNVDTITDFSPVDDFMMLDDGVFSAIGQLGYLAAERFASVSPGGNATNVNQRIVYEQSTGKLFYDADGSGSGMKIQFAQVMAGAALTALDFWVY
jgi:Ca2+-binding RTX toxin-like protein